MVSGIVDLVSDIILASFEVGCILVMTVVLLRAFTTRRVSGLALVAMTSWSRMSRFSAHSPMNCSDVSSWLESNVRC